MSESPSESARLIAEMRQLRDRSGLSLAELANKSGYSKSSWQRYLSGKVLPPWPAVRALCLLTDASEQRLHVLWDLAECAWSGRDVVAAITESPDAAEAAAATGIGIGIG
ncbi:MAG: helix-turn-helix domain-containing protein, partial [Catenulispora sp.]|nr:helix-turn-helix domain-containing protein [Catenulispora sp.]